MKYRHQAFENRSRWSPNHPAIGKSLAIHTTRGRAVLGTHSRPNKSASVIICHARTIPISFSTFNSAFVIQSSLRDFQRKEPRTSRNTRTDFGRNSFSCVLCISRFQFFSGHLLKPFYTPPAHCIMSHCGFAKAHTRRLRHERWGRLLRHGGTVAGTGL